MDLKKAYYYIICLTALFVLAWGVVDLASAATGLIMSRSSVSLEQSAPAATEKEGEPYLEMYYQKKMLYDRLWDSLARIVIAGAIFTYSRIKVNRLEK
jgi:hypothetical protein